MRQLLMISQARGQSSQVPSMSCRSANCMNWPISFRFGSAGQPPIGVCEQLSARLSYICRITPSGSVSCHNSVCSCLNKNTRPIDTYHEIIFLDVDESSGFHGFSLDILLNDPESTAELLASFREYLPPLI